jgi:ubiquinone/menaquinone biosynthesis C-methylase UbiE
LNKGGGPLETQNQARQAVQPFLQILHQILKRPDVKWPTNTIRPQDLLTIDRAYELGVQFEHPNSALNQEMGAHISDLGGIGSPELWNKYFSAYDKVVGFARGFWELALATNEILPKSGKVADFGAGTGNLSTLLGLLQPERHIYALDFSETGLNLARRKFPLLPGYNSSHFHAQIFDLLKDSYPQDEYDGAVMNNVLYTFSPENKLAVLRNILRSLKPGAPFVLSDIVNSTFEERKNFLRNTLLESLQAGAPVTEYDMALMGKINMSVLLAGNLLSLEELSSLAQQAGFEVHGIYKSYYDAAGFLYLTKPNPAVH